MTRYPGGRGGADATQRPGGIRTVRLALDVDGLLQRFGRTVPDAVALLAQIARLRGGSSEARSDRTLEVYLTRFGPAGPEGRRRTELAEDLERLDLSADVAGLGTELLLLADAAELATLAGDGVGVMLMSGRRHPVAQALAAGMPAYVLSDRRVRGPEQLTLVEAERVVAESLRLPTPRPMSEETRTGTVLSLAIADPADARARARAAMREDPRADWIVIGDRLLLYTESDDLERRLIRDSRGERVRGGMHKQALAVTPADARPPGEPLFFGQGYALVVGRADAAAAAGGMVWADARRRAFAQPDSARPPRRAEPAGSSTPESTQDFDATALHGLADAEPERALAALRAILPAIAAPDLATLEMGGPVLTFTSPHATDGSDDLIAVMYDPAPDAQPPRNAIGARGALAAALARRRDAAGVLHCLSPGALPLDALDQLLWQGERNRIAAVIRLESLPDAAGIAVAASSSLVERLQPIFGPVAAIDTTEAGPPVVTVRGTAAVSGKAEAHPQRRVIDLVGAAIAALVP